jgi:hypothetical protein
MQITLYRSFLCPRCFLAKKYLQEIAQQKDNLTIIEVDIMDQPIKSWQDGIRLIPALKIDNKILSGIFLNKTQILNFIEEQQHKTPPNNSTPTL